MEADSVIPRHTQFVQGVARQCEILAHLPIGSAGWTQPQALHVTGDGQFYLDPDFTYRRVEEAGTGRTLLVYRLDHGFCVNVAKTRPSDWIICSEAAIGWCFVQEVILG